MAPHPPRNQSLQDHRGGPMSTIWKVLLAKPGPLVGWCDDEEDVVRTGQGGEFRDRDPDELADRRSPQPAAFRDRPQGHGMALLRRSPGRLETSVVRLWCHRCGSLASDCSASAASARAYCSAVSVRWS